MKKCLEEKDSYIEGRISESHARRKNSFSTWLEYAEFKLLKGSYALSASGFLNAGIAIEKTNPSIALKTYRKGFEACIKGGLVESAIFLVSRMASLLERRKKFLSASKVYMKMADFCESRSMFFLAADSAEHAAELMRAAGKDISNYQRPAELWLKNADYWAGQKNKADEAWSRRRAALYMEYISK
jgi:hypothetical protein